MPSSLTKRTLITYAAPALPLAIPTVAVYVLLPTYYIEEFGLSLGLVGLLLMLARLTDVATDPLIGRWLDYASPRQFKATLALGGFICIPGLLLLVHPFEHAIAASLFVGALTLYFGWTLIQVPYITWLNHIHPDSYEKTRAASFRESFTLIGLFLSACIPLLLLAGLSQTQMLQVTYVITILVGSICLFTLLTQLPAPLRLAHIETGKWREFIQNALALRLLSAWFFNGIANGIPAILFPMYVTSVLGLSEQLRPFFIVTYFIAALLSLPLWLKLSQWVDKTTLWRYAMTLAILAFLPAAFLGPGDWPWFVLICIVTGLTLGADLAIPHVIQTEVADWDKFRFKRKITGFLFALWNGATKFALALAAVIALGLLQLSEVDLNAAAPVAYLGLIYALIPCFLKIMAIGLLWKYPLERQHHHAIIKRLQNRHNKDTSHEKNLNPTAIEQFTS